MTKKKNHPGKLFVFLCLTIAFPFILSAQSNVLDSNIELGNQSAVNNFATSHPNITVINGNLMIGSFTAKTNINDLGALTKILEVRGVITIVNTNLSTLQGLHKLLKANFLVIAQNDKLTTLNNISQLERIYGGLQIDQNPLLQNLEGLEQITVVGDSIPGYLQIYNNVGLKNLRGLESISFIGKNLNISFNDSLQSLYELSSLTHIGDFLVLRNNKTLNSLEGLQNLSELRGGLFVENNPALTNLQHCGVFDSVFHTISIKSNESLTDLTGLENLVYAGKDATIQGNPMLGSLEGLDNLKTIQGSLEIVNNPKLDKLLGLGSLTRITGELRLIGNTSFISFNGADQLSWVGGVSLENNPKLFACNQGFICDALRDARYVYIYGNQDGCSTKQQVEKGCGISTVTDQSPIEGNEPEFRLLQDRVLMISGLDMKTAHLELIDITGRVLLRKQLHPTHTAEVVLPEILSGICIVRLSLEDKTCISKIHIR